MDKNKDLVTKHNLVTPKTQRLSIDLQYLSSDQAQQLIDMFDSPEAYAENFSAIKAITKGLYKVIEEAKPDALDPLARIFKTVNNLQGLLLLNDMQEVERITGLSGLMPDVWHGAIKKGGRKCV